MADDAEGTEMTMVERVARAMWDRHKGLDGQWELIGEFWRRTYTEKAVAALESLREPTQAMILAGEATEDACSMGFARPEWVFPAMIDAALKETA